MSATSDGGTGSGELRELVVEVLERIEREGAGALEEACGRHPEFAERLRARIESLRGLGLVRDAVTGVLPEHVDDFRLIERIGAGGMGVVYRAEQVSLGREVAIKLIRPEILGMQGARERFARETAIIARLQHPGIVPIYTVARGSELPYYAMEWVRGCTLAQAMALLKDREPARLKGADLARAVVEASPHFAPHDDTGEAWLFDGSWEETCLRIARTIAEALEHAHRRGVLHRDIKPGNVMITPGGRVMLVDFGLSHSQGDEQVTNTGERMGSLHYMPPELVRGGPRELDTRSDVYSLGVTLYQLLTLALPFAAPSEPAVMQRILEGRPQSPRSHLPGLSWEAETVCLVALDRDRERRYPTAAAFARDLSNALERRPVEARRAGVLLRARRWVERRPGIAAALALAAALVVVVPALIVNYERRERTRAQEALAELREEEAQTARERDEVQRQGQRAERNYAIALETVDRLLRRVADEELDEKPGMIALRESLAAEAVKAYRALIAEQPERLELAHLGAGIGRLRASVLRRQGRLADAQLTLQEALDVLAPHLDSGDPQILRDHTQVLDDLAFIRFDPELQEQAIEAMRDQLREHPDDLETRSLLSGSLATASNIERVQGQRSSAELIDEAVAIARDVVAAQEDADTLRGLAEVLSNRGSHAWSGGDLDAALKDYEEAFALATQSRELEPEASESRRCQVHCGVALSGVLGQLKRGEDAGLVLDEIVTSVEWLIRNYPDDSSHLLMAANFHLDRGIATAQAGRPEDSLEDFERCVEYSRRADKIVPESSSGPFNEAKAWICRAGSLLVLERFDEGLEACDRAASMVEVAVDRSPDYDDARVWRAVQRLQRARILLALERQADAAEVLRPVAAQALHRRVYARQGVGLMWRCLTEARRGGDPEVLDAVAAAAIELIADADQRGDLRNEPVLESLRASLEAP